MLTRTVIRWSSSHLNSSWLPKHQVIAMITRHYNTKNHIQLWILLRPRILLRCANISMPLASLPNVWWTRGLPNTRSSAKPGWHCFHLNPKVLSWSGIAYTWWALVLTTTGSGTDPGITSIWWTLVLTTTVCWADPGIAFIWWTRGLATTGSWSVLALPPFSENVDWRPQGLKPILALPLLGEDENWRPALLRDKLADWWPQDPDPNLALFPLTYFKFRSLIFRFWHPSPTLILSHWKNNNTLLETRQDALYLLCI